MSTRPKPTAIRALQGNSGHRPLNDAEPQPDRTRAPEMPKGMDKTAQREWKRIVPELQDMGVLSVVDGKALAAYCDAYAVWEMAVRDCKKYGLMIEVKFLDKEGELVIGDLKKNPAVAIRFEAAKVMKSFLIEFGLTPASRTKLKIEKAKGDDPMDGLLNRNKTKAEQTSPDPAPSAGLDDFDENSTVM